MSITAEVLARYAPPFGPGQSATAPLERGVIEVRGPNGTTLRRGPR
ncbi:MAG: hypothetical protein R2724_26185 [Bryobacterales bacterium]